MSLQEDLTRNLLGDKGRTPREAGPRKAGRGPGDREKAPGPEHGPASPGQREESPKPEAPRELGDSAGERGSESPR